MHALPLLLGALCVLAIAYRYYSAFIAARVLQLDDSRVTPAHRFADGHNYVPTNRWVLFGHHFAAITGAGPLLGPVLATQFGFLPGLLWLLIGVTLGGAVHDFVILVASVRRGGRSLAEIARAEVGPVSGAICAVATLAIVIISLAGLGLAVVKALEDSPWGTFSIAMSIVIALGMGLYMYRWRKGAIRSGTIAGVVLLLTAIWLGGKIGPTWLGPLFTLSKGKIVIAIASYGFFASVLPVWMLLCPRDYLSSYMKLGTIAVLVLGILIINPTLHAPAIAHQFLNGGPIVAGKIYPFVFITIACGAISGFHSLVASGTTPKMISRESDCRPIGYGAMLLECLVGVTALIAASALHQGDYFAINAAPEVFAKLNLAMVNLPELQRQVGETLVGRTGGAVSLAVGMAQIFSALPGIAKLQGMLAYWYHFAIMFEALFILTTIDTGTRVARFMVQELLSRVLPRRLASWGRPDWLPGTLISTTLVCLAWTQFILTDSIRTIWPMFGIANQLLATTALAVGTSVLVNEGRVKYLWVTVVPLLFVAVTTLTAGWESIQLLFVPMLANAATATRGWINLTITASLMLCVGIVLVDVTRKCAAAVNRRSAGSAKPAHM